MGDVLHALPAVADLKRGWPETRLSWLIDPRWLPLIEGNPDVDETIPFDRRSWSSLRYALRKLRTTTFDAGVDLQGLLKSALMLRASRSRLRYGFAMGELRERLAAMFYDRRIATAGPHVVDRNRELAQAAGSSTNGPARFHIPPGSPEGSLPDAAFVLANPHAGWPAKEWPLENYAPLGGRLRDELGVELVLNSGSFMPSLAGLIHATRRAAAVLGLDSGPTHLAAALNKPGVALFGPTDPARNGPYGDSFTVLRSPAARTSYKRAAEPDASLVSLTVDEVFCALKDKLKR